MAALFIIFPFIFCCWRCFFQSAWTCLPNPTGNISETPTLTQKRLLPPCGMDSHSILAALVELCMIRFFFFSFPFSLTLVSSITFYLKWLGSEFRWSCCWCRRALPQILPKHIFSCLFFVPSWICYHSTCLWGPLTAWRVFTESSDHCLRSLLLENLSLHFPLCSSCGCVCRGLLKAQASHIRAQRIH